MIKINFDSPEKNKEKEYEFFYDEDSRREVYEFCRAVADYLHEQNIPNFVMVDRSSRPMYLGVDAYWRSKYPDEPAPNTYFLNPMGFIPTDEMTGDEIFAVRYEALCKDNQCNEPARRRSQEDIAVELQNTYKKLVNDKDKPLLVFDSCIHSGDTLEPIISTLKEMGFSDVRVGAINPSPENSKVKTDFYITRYKPEKGCYPFDRDRMIDKNFDHVYSKPTKAADLRARSIRLRLEISGIIKDYLNEGK